MAKPENAKPKIPPNSDALLPARIESKRDKIEGRKPAITPTVLVLLREAFLLGCDDVEACLHAGISTSTLYLHQQNNKMFTEWKHALKRHPFLKARKTIVEHLERDPEFALKYMERKKRSEFQPSVKLAHEDTLAPLNAETKALADNILSKHMAKQQERANAKQPLPASN